MEILIAGRGGQGAVTAARLLATAAFHEGKEVQAFPHFGIERRGAPTYAFLRIDKKPILIRSEIEKPDFAIILDPMMINDARVVKAEKVYINSSRSIKGTSHFDGTSIAIKIFGSDIVNTVMSAFFCAKTKIISKKALIEACSELWHTESLQKNIKSIEETFSKLR